MRHIVWFNQYHDHTRACEIAFLKESRTLQGQMIILIEWHEIVEMNFKKKIFNFMIPSVQYDAHDGRTSGQKYTQTSNFVQKWPMG